MLHFSVAINGYVAETLPGLLVAQNQRVRWHLLNVGSDGEYHAVHFHGLPFTLHTKEEHRMGVYNLFPGKQSPKHISADEDILIVRVIKPIENNGASIYL